MSQRQSPMLARGTQLGPYEVLAPLGAGGMGEVYRARDTRLSRDVALKVMSARSSTDGDRLRRFEQEARAASVLNHPNVVVIYDVGMHDGFPYVVAELLEGETLRDRIAEGPLPASKAIDIGVQVARGLTAAHDKGIVHRDLKPENVFVTKPGVVKILDFGVAKLAATASESIDDSASTMIGQTHSGAVIGTAPYMSPEQARGQRVDARTDIFCVGIILYEMLSGRNPFLRESAVETMNAIIRDEPPPLAADVASVPPGLERVVMHCLEKRAHDRFQSAQDLGFALGALGTLTGSGTNAVAVTDDALAPPTRRRWAAALGALALLVALPAAFFVGRYAGYVTGAHAGQAGASFHRLTFHRGRIGNARIAPDGQTIVYSALSDGPRPQIFSTRPESRDSRPVALPDGSLLSGDLLSVSSDGEIALLLGGHGNEFVTEGTLARVPLGGGAPREVLEDVADADWSPDGRSLAVVHDVEGRTQLEYPIGSVLVDDERVTQARVSPSGDRVAFVALRNDLYYVGVVDLARNRTVLSGGWTNVFRLAWAPSGDEIWFAAGHTTLATDALHAVDLSGRDRVVAQLPGSAVINDISRDGKVLLTDATLRAELMCQPPGETKERRLSWLDISVARGLSDDGRTLLINEDGEGGGERFSVYVRKTDGSPAVRVAEGMRGLAISPDAKYVLAVVASPPQLVLLPTGAGEQRSFPNTGIAEYNAAAWFPDGKRFVFVGSEAGRSGRAYVSGLGSELPRPVTPEGVDAAVVSPDGRFVAVHGANVSGIYPVDGGEPRLLTDMAKDDSLLQWSLDGRSLYLYRISEIPRRIYRFDVATGRRMVWKEITPPDVVGNTSLLPVQVARDGRTYAYTVEVTLSDLYLVDGWK